MIINILIGISLGAALGISLAALKIAKSNRKYISAIYKNLIEQQTDILSLNKSSVKRIDDILKIYGILDKIVDNKTNQK